MKLYFSQKDSGIQEVQSSEASSGINWETIVFRSRNDDHGRRNGVDVGFFRWLCMRLAKLVKYQVVSVVPYFYGCCPFVLAMFIDSITVILFLAAVTIELAELVEI